MQIRMITLQAKTSRCVIEYSEYDYRIVWSKMREELDSPEEMQLYSLKDTGITAI